MQDCRHRGGLAKPRSSDLSAPMATWCNVYRLKRTGDYVFPPFVFSVYY